MKSAIIFGVAGQDGSHLADLLLEKKLYSNKNKRRSSSDNTQRIQHIITNPTIKSIDTSQITKIFGGRE